MLDDADRGRGLALVPTEERHPALPALGGLARLAQEGDAWAHEAKDDPNVTDKKFPGNPTRSYRTRDPVRIIGELEGWVGHAPEQLQARRNGLAELKRRGAALIYD